MVLSRKVLVQVRSMQFHHVSVKLGLPAFCFGVAQLTKVLLGSVMLRWSRERFGNVVSVLVGLVPYSEIGLRWCLVISG